MKKAWSFVGAGALLGVGVLGSPVLAGPNNLVRPVGDPRPNLSLHGADAFSIGGGGAAAQENGGAAPTAAADGGYALSGPYFLRSADPEPLGEAELKFVYGYTNNGDDDDETDEHEIEFVLEWGMAQNVEFILEVPFQIGDGRVDGNGDITALGFHVRHWEENGWLPAFATRHLVRLPTGYHSDGVDYTGRGLLTWTLAPNAWRLHFNPFLTSKNGNFDDEDEDWWSWDGDDEGGEQRHFLWGAAIGFDFQLTDNMVFIVDYQNLSSESEGHRNQHVLELGGEWEFAEHQKLGWQTEFGIDGDEAGADFGARLSYILEICLPGLGG